MRLDCEDWLGYRRVTVCRDWGELWSLAWVAYKVKYFNLKFAEHPFGLCEALGMLARWEHGDSRKTKLARPSSQNTAGNGIQ